MAWKNKEWSLFPARKFDIIRAKILESRRLLLLHSANVTIHANDPSRRYASKRKMDNAATWTGNRSTVERSLNSTRRNPGVLRRDRAGKVAAGRHFSATLQSISWLFPEDLKFFSSVLIPDDETVTWHFNYSDAFPDIQSSNINSHDSYRLVSGEGEGGMFPDPPSLQMLTHSSLAPSLFSKSTFAHVCHHKSPGSSLKNP